MRGLRQDLRLAFRSLLGQPGLLSVAVTSVALGVAANALAFAVFDSLLLRPVPGVAEPDRVVEIGRTVRGDGWHRWDFPDFRDLSLASSDAFEAVAAAEMGAVTLLGEAEGARRVPAMFVTSGYFAVMGVQPVIGRTFVQGEDTGTGAHPVAVLSHAAWRALFDESPAALGQTVRVDGDDHVVVGVVTGAFVGHSFGDAPFLWLPLVQYGPARTSDLFFEDRSTVWLQVLGRLHPESTIESANAVLTTVFGRLAETFPDTNANRGARARKAGLVPAEARAAVAVSLSTVFAVLLLVLATAGANVAGTMLSKAAARERVLAVRIALGADRGRLLQYLATESALVFATGGVAGLVLARWGTHAADFGRLLPLPLPVDVQLQLDGRVLLFTAALVVVAAALFGVLPALRATDANLEGILRSGSGATNSRLGRRFVTAQLAVATVLLITGSLFLRSLAHSGQIDVGFEIDGLHVASIDLSGTASGSPSVGDRAGALAAAATRLPGVVAASATTDVPLDGRTVTTSVRPAGRELDGGFGAQAHHASVTPRHFETLGVARLRGRTFDEGDRVGAERVAVVSSELARQLWPDDDAVGRHVAFGLDAESYTVIGVVENVRVDLAPDGAASQLYTSLAQIDRPSVHLLVRTDGAADVAAGLRGVLAALEPEAAVPAVTPLATLAAMRTLPNRIAAGAGVGLGALALLLASLGVYGVVSLATMRRTKEIGVRVALGARRDQTLGLVIGSGLALAAPGVLLGAAAAAALAGVLRALLLGVAPLDPLAFTATGLVLCVVVVAATLPPALFAMSVPPAEALRRE